LAKQHAVALTEGDLEFEVFMRINARFQENFSIGLEYLPKDERGSLCLLRCNGPHGIFLGNPAVPQQHFLPHLHKAKPENITLGLRPEKGGEATREYVSYPQALVYFLKTIRVTNAEEFFPNIGQLSLNLEKEDQNHELS